MSITPELIAADSRSYTTAKAVIDDYLKGKDFLLPQPGGLKRCSCRDFLDQQVILRFGEGHGNMTTVTKEA
jgi:hypothetical protein